MRSDHRLTYTVRSAPAIIGYGAGLAVVLAAFNYTGGRLQGYSKDPEVDEVGRKEYLRRNRRRPLEDTVAELGEGRGTFALGQLSFVNVLIIPGIRAPGYEDRRAQRLKERYGFEVPAPQSAAP